MKTIITIAILLALTGCAGKSNIRSFGNNESYVVTPDNKKYLVSLRKDAIIEFKDGEVEFKVDNRGREGMIEGLIKLYGVKVLSDD